tara:strand:+ start:560 stop:865 length:306 start_codon:yes stop_codon:yes gene_type:complete
MVFVALGAAAVGYQYYSGQRAHEQQKKQLAMQEQANKDAKQRAKEAADRADIEMNRANRKKPDVEAIKRKNEADAGGTMLTGNQGIELDKSNLGGNTLLGG